MVDRPSMHQPERLSPARLEQLDAISEAVGHSFGDPRVLDRALTHASLGNEGRASYERLEFLGDAVLDFLVAEFLYEREPEFPEGQLTDLRAKHVSREPLAAIARRLGLPSALLVGRGLRAEELGSERIQADLVEAILAAVYLDGGMRAARAFVRRHVLRQELFESELGRKKRDPKSRLLHLSQRLALGQPRYKLLETSGPDHSRDFTVGVLIRDKQLGTGSARSKQAAEMIAAEEAIDTLESDGFDQEDVQSSRA